MFILFMKVKRDTPSSYTFFNHVYYLIALFHRTPPAPYVQINTCNYNSCNKMPGFSMTNKLMLIIVQGSIRGGSKDPSSFILPAHQTTASG